MLSLLFSAIGVLGQSWIPFPTEKYTQNATLTTGSNKTMQLFWQVTDDSIEFGLASQNGQTWLGLGVSDAGGMKGADVWVGHQKDGKFALEDRYSSVPGAPELDSSQDLTLLKSYQTGNITGFTFTRKLSTCDEKDMKISLTSPQWFIYALGTNNEFGKHGPGDNGQILLDISGNYFKKFSEPPQNSTVLSVIAPSFNIPQETTVYCYSYHEFTNLEKSHILVEDSKISSPFVHHLVGYLCDQPLTTLKPGQLLCNHYDEANYKVNFNNTCSRLYTTWAKGGKRKLYPSDVGKPIGKSEYNTLYMVMETHYNNPNLLQNQVDPGSGLEFTISTQLRKYDIGVVTLGTPQDTMFLAPGGYPSAVSECGPKCTTKDNAIPPSGLTVISTGLHMHKRGKSISTRHIRNDKELTKFPSMDHFDFDYQSYTYADMNVDKILPGDRLITNCTFDTTQDTKVVEGGWSSEQEMCYAFVEYYPAMKYFPVCEQIPDFTHINGAPSALIAMSNAMECPTSNNDSNSVVMVDAKDMPSFIALPQTCPANGTSTSPSATPSVKSNAIKAFPFILWIMFV
ncbi:hypothetical protein HK103_003805 [Boothiomyces macroporosus]|uniref:DOMON domain-containing protein n=1 Tax=Boothiomyces macroporosus TaxID=261099 RepID=A0AAD5UM35_9FUNG|nr:hypothetical protein HK103_003805 [Boothiomyces macroporosus]